MDSISIKYNLGRFISIQDRGDTYNKVKKELAHGKKESHWMWYIFPQMKGLGFSSISLMYGIESLDEAKAYSQNTILGSRLIECCRLLLTHKEANIFYILGDVDAIKLKSSMTLFELAADDKTIFAEVLNSFYDGERDKQSICLLCPVLK